MDNTMARDLCLIAAAAAGVVPIDTIAADINDLEGLKAESIAAPALSGGYQAD